MTTTTRPGKVLLVALSVSGPLISLSAQADETLPYVEEHEGRLRFRAQLPLPPARGQYQPGVTFVNEEGWTRLIPAPTIYYFSDGLYGYHYWDQRADYVPLRAASRDGADHWAMSVEDAYLDLVPTMSSNFAIAWDAWDAKGTHYRFEEVASPSPHEYTLRRVTDANGNRTEYDYTWLNGQSRLTGIRYNFYDPANPGSTSAVPASATAFATKIIIEYDASFRPFRVQLTNQPPSGPVTVRSFEVGWGAALDRNALSFTEVTQSSARRLVTSFEWDPADSSRLKAVTNSRGARVEATYASGRVASTTLSGPGLAPRTTTYWYVPADRTVSQDNVTRIVRSTWWEPSIQKAPAVIEWGTQTAPGSATTPPQYAVFKQRVIERTWRDLSTATCTPPVNSGGVMIAAAPPAGAAFWFESRIRDTTWIDGSAMTRERTASCSNVDAYGNVHGWSVDMDVNRPHDEYAEVLTYAPPTLQHSCTDCVLTRGRFNPVSEVWMSHERYTYDSAGHLKEVWRREQSASPELLVSAWEHNGNGTLSTATEGATVRSFQYDAPYQLRVAKQTVAEGTKSLVTDFAYDDFANLNLITGPYLGGATPGPQKGIKYDDVGRPTAVARQPIMGTTITEGIAAFQYVDGSASTPSRVTTYSFAVPLTFSEGTPPATPDVVQRSVFHDAFGRAIQVRERLGGAGAAAPGAHVVDNLGAATFRVSGVIIYDGAGRVTAALEPFYSASGDFVDYRTSSIDNLLASNPVGTHVTLRSYDAQGRPTCEAYRPVASGASIPAPGSCRSNFTEGLSYTRATTVTYRALNGLLGVKSIPSENNLATTPATPEGRSPMGPESFFDASGRLISTLDVDLNSTSFSYDAAGRLTTMSRSPSTTVAGRPASVVASFSYDLMDRVIERTDPNAGTRTFWYDAQGRITRVQLPEKPPLGSGVRDELRFDYDMGRLSATKACIATSASPPTTCTIDWSLTYDQAPDGQQAPGQLAYAQKQGLASIRYAYSPEGIPLRRTYTLAGIQGTFDISDTLLLDGRIAGSTIASPAGSFSFEGHFDSFGRPAKITSAVGGGTTYWAPLPSATPLTGAYDALGRLGAVDLDQTGTGSSLAHASWQYKPYSGLLDAARASLGLSPGTTDVYWVTGRTYRGSKLTGYRDEVGRTDYSYWYTDAGQLRGATATPFATSPLSQNSSMCSSYTLSKAFGAGASFGNLELVRETRSPAFSDTYAYGGQGVQTAVPPGPDAPTALTTNSSQNPFLYDHAGRVSSKGLGTESFEYDLFNRLVRVARSGVQAEALAHDPLGLLLGRLSANQVTYYLGGRATVTATALPGCTAPGCAVDPSTVSVDVHLAAGATRVASVRVQGGSTGRVLYYHRDHLGSVVATSKGGGIAGASYRYGPWGDLRVAQGDSGDAASDRGFADSIRLSGTLLVMGVRVYDTQLRQFLQPDPIDPMTYTYVRGDPINRVDPTGMVSEAIDPPMPRNDAEVMLYVGEGWRGYAALLVYGILYRSQLDRVQSHPEFNRVRLLPRADTLATYFESPSTYFDDSPCPPGFCEEIEVKGSRTRSPNSWTRNLRQSLKDFDYITIGIGYFTGFGVNIHLTLDRNGYITWGPAGGVGAGLKSTGIAFGSYQMKGKQRPSVWGLRGFNTGTSINFSGSYGLGFGVNYPVGSGVYALESQVALPGVGLTIGYSWEIGRIEELSW